MQLRSASVRPGSRQVREIDPEAVGDRQAGPFADDHDQRLNAHPLADVVTERDPSLGGDHRRRDRVPLAEGRHQRRQQTHAMVDQGARR